MTASLNLKGLAALAQTTAPTGDALRVPLNLIDPDPGQPRKHFDEDALRELAASAKRDGILVPISIRPNPDKPGRYIINWGERRYRASILAGLADIPVVIHRKFSAYHQVIENEQRAGLTPMEIAMFVQGEVAKGVAKGKIAEQLGKKNSYVTDHLALVEAPLCVEHAYARGITSPRTLYDLRQAYEEFPEQVAAWMTEDQLITRKTIAALVERLRQPPNLDAQIADAGAHLIDVQQHQVPAAPAAGFRHDEIAPPPAPTKAPQQPAKVRAVHDQPPGTSAQVHPHLAVIGHLDGDQTRVLRYEGMTVEQARKAGTKDLRAGARGKGQDCYIDHILTSVAPILIP